MEDRFRTTLKEAKRGDDKAFMQLGDLIRSDLTGQSELVSEERIEEVVRYYATAAVMGNVRAQKELGDCYLYGIGVDKNISYAKQWYENANKRHYEPAKRRLEEIGQLGFGRFYENREEKNNKKKDSRQMDRKRQELDDQNRKKAAQTALAEIVGQSARKAYGQKQILRTMVLTIILVLAGCSVFPVTNLQSWHNEPIAAIQVSLQPLP